VGVNGFLTVVIYFLCMQSSSLNSHFRKTSPPSLKPKRITPQVKSVDTRAAEEETQDSKFRQTLKAMASLALVLAPQALEAAEAAPSTLLTTVENPEVAEEPTLLDTLEAKVDTLKETAESFQESLDPHGYLEEKQFQVGEYDLRLNPMDLDLRPRLKSGSPALKFKGEILETTLSKSDDIGGGWVRMQGAAAKLRGEVSTYSEPIIDLQGGLYREYSGPVGENYEAKLQAEVGVRHRFMGEDVGLRAGVSFRQELEGGNHQLFGHDYQLYAEGRQSAYRNLTTGESDLSYSFMVGPKKDFDVSLFGKKGTVTVTVGPEIKGSSQGEAFDVGIETKVRTRF
jgi:hypothetical protein